MVWCAEAYNLPEPQHHHPDPFLRVNKKKKKTQIPTGHTGENTQTRAQFGFGSLWSIHSYKNTAKSCTASGEFGYLLVYEMGFLPSWLFQGGGLFLVFVNTSAVETENYLNMDYTTTTVLHIVHMIILLYEDGKHDNIYHNIALLF